MGSDWDLIFEVDLLDCRFIEEGELVKKEAKMIKKVQEKDSAVCHTLPFWNTQTAQSLTQCTYRAFAVTSIHLDACYLICQALGIDKKDEKKKKEEEQKKKDEKKKEEEEATSQQLELALLFDHREGSPVKIEAKEKEQPVKKIEPKVLRTDSVNKLLEFFYRAETRLTDIVCRKEPIPEVEWCFPQQRLYVLLELLGSRCSKTISRSLDLLLVHTRSSEKKAPRNMKLSARNKQISFDF